MSFVVSTWWDLPFCSSAQMPGKSIGSLCNAENNASCVITCSVQELLAPGETSASRHMRSPPRADKGICLWHTPSGGQISASRYGGVGIYGAPLQEAVGGRCSVFLPITSRSQVLPCGALSAIKNGSSELLKTTFCWERTLHLISEHNSFFDEDVITELWSDDLSFVGSFCVRFGL